MCVSYDGDTPRPSTFLSRETDDHGISWDLGWPGATLLEFPKLQKLTNWGDLGENSIRNVVMYI